MYKALSENPNTHARLQPEKQEKEKFEANVRLAISQAYKEVAVEYKDRLMDPRAEEIYWQPMCQEFSEKLHTSLLPLNAEPKYVYINRLPKYLQANFRHHIYLAVVGPDGEDYFIDGTWQQFMEKLDKKTGLVFESAQQMLDSAAAKSAPKEIRDLWEIGLCMLESRQLVGKANTEQKIKIKNVVLGSLSITEKDYESFLSLKSNFGIEQARQILELIKVAKSPFVF